MGELSLREGKLLIRILDTAFCISFRFAKHVSNLNLLVDISKKIFEKDFIEITVLYLL